MAVTERSDTAGRSLSPSELFFYQGADREQILLEEGQQVVVKGDLSSPREDVDTLVPQKFKKTYLEAKYSLDDYEKKLDEWEDLIPRLFIRKR